MDKYQDDFSCQKHLDKMMRTIEPFMHPANEGDHTGMVLTFLQYLIREFLGRYEDERVKKNKRKVSAFTLGHTNGERSGRSRTWEARGWAGFDAALG